jgi:deoxyribodipyrimidine photo-lyase
MQNAISIFWFRRDLRLDDNAGLFHALKGEHPVLPVFIFDKDILDQLDEKADRRVEFIHVVLHEMQSRLMASGSTLEVYYGFPEDVFDQLLGKYAVKEVFTNHDYEPYARTRDEMTRKKLEGKGIRFHTFKDQVIFEKDEVIKANGEPYTVFTPYSKKWLSGLNEFYLKSYPAGKLAEKFYRQSPQEIPSLESMGFKEVDKPFPSLELDEELVRKYGEARNFPGYEGTSRMGVHLRFGTVSIRELTRKSLRLSAVYVNELIWRDFYQMILWKFPGVGTGKAFKPSYDRIRWRNNEEEFQQWCEGNTGYPIVDAGMRELNATGFMHNRVRMIVASFLTKHLLVDWRWGEAYFAEKLLDYELASNNGGWQWSSGSGCDSAPYFRIFNPYIQTKKFDPDLKYVRQWVPEFEEPGYPAPMVVHEFARKRCLEVYSRALKNEG